MASIQSSEKLFFHNALELLDVDGDYTGAGAVPAWRDMRDYSRFAVMAKPSVLAGNGIIQLEIVAADDGSGTNLVVVKDSGVVAADAIGDYVALECSAEEIRDLSERAGYASRYVGARITHHDAGDESVALYMRAEPRFPRTGLTATTIA